MFICYTQNIVCRKLGYRYTTYEAGRGAAARGVTVKPTGCGFDPYSRR